MSMRGEREEAMGLEQRVAEGAFTLDDWAERTLSTTRMHEGPVVAVDHDRVRLPDGRESLRELVRHSGGACILPLYADGTVSVVSQYRKAFERLTVELPAGKLEYGEEPLNCALRELQEECGARALEHWSLGTALPSPGYCGERLYLFAALAEAVGPAEPDPGEFLLHSREPLEEMIARAARAELEDAKSVIALLRLSEQIRREADGDWRAWLEVRFARLAAETEGGARDGD